MVMTYETRELSTVLWLLLFAILSTIYQPADWQLIVGLIESARHGVVPVGLLTLLRF
jgi:hypothetical protein